MFSGIVSHKSKVLKVESFSDFIRIHISSPQNFNKGLKKEQVFQLMECASPLKIMATKILNLML